MSQSNLLIACSQRLIGDDYLGWPTVQFDPNHLQRRKLPMSPRYERPTLTFVPDSETDSIETRSIGSNSDTQRVTPLEYRITGITWWTPRYVNSCNLDSFLSAWVRKIRQTHGKFLDYLQAMDRMGVTLVKIADHALCAKDAVDSNIVKGMWISAILQNSRESSKLANPPLDCTGNNIYSIFQHLFLHCGFEIVSTCPCGRFYNYDFVITVSTVLQIKHLGNQQTFTAAEMPTCVRCNTPRILRQLNPIATDFMIVFSYRSAKADESPLLDDIPRFLVFGTIQYKLEYLSYSQETTLPNCYHEVSLQFIRQQWYIFDSALSPRFRWWGGKRYTYRNARLETIVYFRL
jgi:hypothetical protein